MEILIKFNEFLLKINEHLLVEYKVLAGYIYVSFIKIITTDEDK